MMVSKLQEDADILALLPLAVKESLENYCRVMDEMENGIKHYDWDIYADELISNINICEVENILSSENAWYLRRKYLGITNTIE